MNVRGEISTYPSQLQSRDHVKAEWQRSLHLICMLFESVQQGGRRSSSGETTSVYNCEWSGLMTVPSPVHALGSEKTEKSAD